MGRGPARSAWQRRAEPAPSRCRLRESEKRQNRYKRVRGLRRTSDLRRSLPPPLVLLLRRRLLALLRCCLLPLPLLPSLRLASLLRLRVATAGILVRVRLALRLVLVLVALVGDSLSISLNLRLNVARATRLQLVARGKLELGEEAVRIRIGRRKLAGHRVDVENKGEGLRERNRSGLQTD